MTAIDPQLAKTSSDRTRPVFSGHARADFAASYPEGPHKLEHELVRHPLLELESLAQLAESLPEKSIEFNSGDQPIGLEGEAATTGLSIGETIRNIDTANSWSVLKNIEQIEPYKKLLHSLLSEIEAPICAKTGEMMRMQGFIFVSSPNAVTPFHFDPEHNILLQLRGSKEMTVFPAGDARFVPDAMHESYHTGGGRELLWEQEFAENGAPFNLSPGEAIYVPVMAPHFVRVGDVPTISLSITWRSQWSFAEADARSFNHFARGFGLKPNAPGRWPKSNKAKAYAWRALRRLPKIA